MAHIATDGTPLVLLAATVLAAPACHGLGGATPPGDDAGPGSDAGAVDPWEELLATRETDYSAALKAAAIRLTGDLPTLAEVYRIANAPEDARRAEYRALLRDYLERPAFARQMLHYWRDTFRIGDTPEHDQPGLDTAPVFAARLSVENGSYLDLFTKGSANCPTFDEASSTFHDGECTNGGPRAGVLTNPAVMAAFSSNLGFRRVRWIQETFGCARFPVEVSGPPQNVGGLLPYLGVWPFDSVASPETGGRIDFRDASSTVCMNCHQTMNHIAPLFAHYDRNGVYQSTIAVDTPFDGPLATRADYLPDGEATAWRHRVPAADIPALGAAMAADPEIARCAVARMWNWALGKADIVDAQQGVPTATIQPELDAFIQGGHRIKDLVFAVFDSEDFTRY